MRLLTQTLLAIGLLQLAMSPVLAASCVAKSGAHTVPLLELYTSEGCSSCPPADKWLNQLTQPADQVIPLAFHVDYWDYIGWKDRFSKAEFSARQRKSAAFSGLGFVYTPQFVFNGRDFKGWDDSRLNSAIALEKKYATRANLSLEATPTTDGRLLLQASAQAVNPADIPKADIFIALYENNLSSEVQAGENQGRLLKHNYVVRDFFGAYQLNNQNSFNKRFTLNADWRGKDGGAVIFVQDASNGQIMQSLALKFCS